MRRRALALSSAAAAAAAILFAATAPASAAAPEPHVVGDVAGISGPIIDMALSPDGSTGYVVDQSSKIAIFDTATNQVTGHSIDFTPYGTPVSVSVSPDGSSVFVGAGYWVVTLNPDGTLDTQIGLGSGSLRSIAAVPKAGAPVASVVATETAASPGRFLRYNLGSSVTGVSFAPEAPTSVADIAVGPGDGFDNDVVVSGTAGGEGVLYVFDSPFAPTGPSHVVPLAGTTLATAVALSADASTAIVTAPAENEAFLVDVASGAITATVTTSVPGFAAAFSPDGATAYVVGGSDLVVIDTASGTVTADVAIGTTQAAAVVVSPSGNRIWVGDDMPSGTVRMLSFSTLTASAASTSGTVGTAVSAAFTASGFDLPVTYSVSPALPAGLALDATTGVVSGTPSAAQAATTYTVIASSGDGDSATANWSLTIAEATSGGGTLPDTGGDVPAQLAQSGQDAPWPLAAGAAAALALGLTLVFAARRRRA
jgi:hypothetical protein